jgi:hypothetical protein
MANSERMNTFIKKGAVPKKKDIEHDGKKKNVFVKCHQGE